MATVTQTCLLGVVVLLATLVSRDAYSVSDINQCYGYDIEPKILAKLGNCDLPTALKKLREYGKHPKDNSGSISNWYRGTTFPKLVYNNLGDYGRFDKPQSFESAEKKNYNALGNIPNDFGYLSGNNANRFKNSNALKKYMNHLGGIGYFGRYPDGNDIGFTRHTNLSGIDGIQDNGSGKYNNNLGGIDNFEKYSEETSMGTNGNQFEDNGLWENNNNLEGMFDFERYPGENIVENNGNQFDNIGFRKNIKHLGPIDNFEIYSGGDAMENNSNQFEDNGLWENNNNLQEIDNFGRHPGRNVMENNGNQFGDNGLWENNNNLREMDDLGRYAGRNGMENNTNQFGDNSLWENNNINLQGMDDLGQYPGENNFELYHKDDNDNGNLFTTTPVVPVQIDRANKPGHINVISNGMFHTNPSFTQTTTTTPAFQYSLTTKIPNQNVQSPFHNDKNHFTSTSTEDCEFPTDDGNEMWNSLHTQPKESFETSNTRPTIMPWSSSFKPTQNNKYLLPKRPTYIRAHPIPKLASWFARVKQMLRSNTLSYTLLRDILHTLLPNADWTMSNPELLADIIYVLHHKNNTDFSKLINGLFDYKFDGDYNALYFVLGIKWQVTVNFDLWAFLKGLFSDSFAGEVLSNNNQKTDYIIPKFSSSEDFNNSPSINPTPIFGPQMSWRDQMKQILHSNKLNYTLLKNILRTLFPNASWNMSNQELLTDILYVLQNNNNSDFSRLINGLFKYDFGGDYNALYYVLGIKGQVPTNFNLWAFLKSLFPNNQHFANQLLPNNNIKFNHVIPISGSIISSSEDFNIGPSINKHPAPIFVPQMSWRDRLNSREPSDVVMSGEQTNSNEFNISPNKEFGMQSDDSDHFIGCVMFKILKKTFPAINETFISKVVLNTVTDYIKKNNLYTHVIRRLA